MMWTHDVNGYLVKMIERGMTEGTLNRFHFTLNVALHMCYAIISPTA